MYRMWLASLEENTPEVRAELLAMSKDYCSKSKVRATKPEDIVEWFQGFTATNTSTPQVFIGWKDITPIAFIITEAVEVDGRTGIQITHGYLKPEFNNSTLSRQFMTVVEGIAKQSGFSFVSCITHLDPHIYSRWIQRAGYKMDYTAYVKEL